MALTRANVEALLISRIGKLFVGVSKDGTTVDGANADLNDPIGYSIRQCGQTVDDAMAVDDDDVARVSDVDKLLDIAEFRALESAQSAAASLVTMTLGPRKEQLSDMADAIAELVKAKRKANGDMYGAGRQQLTAGVLGHGFQAVNE